MANRNFTIRLDENIKKEAESLFEELGLTLSAAINIFLRQAIREQRIPFEISKDIPVQFVDPKTLEAVANEEIEEHFEAYKELAK